jgi:hypothetical protein
MKKQDFNNPYRRHTVNRIGRVKGNMGVFNEPTPVTVGKVEEVEYGFDDDDNQIEITLTFEPVKFIFWVCIITLLDLLFFSP